MKPRSHSLLRHSRLALVAITIGTAPIFAGTAWDGGGGATTDINEALNWGGTVNSLDGTTAASFATGGSTANMNVPARFTTLTFNRDDAAGFTVGGTSILAVNNSGSGSTINFLVSDTAGNGATTITSPFQVNTASGATRLLNINNLEKDIPAGSLIISGNVNASTPANTFAIRAGGTGVTVFNGTLSNVSAIQQVNSGTSSGKVIINGNQSLGSATVNIPTTTSGTVTSAYTIQMGAASTDVQSWSATAINQPSTVLVKSTATLTGAVGVGNGAALSGATLVVDGSLTSASTLALGGASVTGKLKVGGSASFTGAVTIGAAVGSTIVGNAATNGTLSLSSGTISGSVSIGGAGTNENNLNLTKINGGVLTLNGTHTYTGATTVNAGTLTLGGSIASAATVNSGGLLKITGSTSAPVSVNASGAVGGTGTISNTLTFGTGNSTLNYELTGPLNATSVDVSTATAVIVSPAATPVNGTPYVALKRSTGTFSGGDFGKFTLATRGGVLSLTGGATEITITPAASAAASLIWKGNVSSAWEASPVQNWTNGGSPDRFYTDDAVTFDDTASSFAVAIAGTSVTPGNITFNNASPNDYTVSGGTIAGTASLTKSGTGTVTLTQTGTNTFNGALNLEAGVLSFSNLNQIGGGASTRAVTLKGGALQYTGGIVTTDAIPVVLNSGTSTINVSTLGTTLRFGAAVTGAGNLVKAGAGILALGKNGSNAAGSTPDPKTTGSTFTGSIQVNAGALETRCPDSLGANGPTQGTSVDNASLIIFPFGQNQGIVLDPEPLSISGTSYFITSNQDLDTDITNEWTGPVTVAADAVVGLGSPRANATAIGKFIVSGAISTSSGSILKLGKNAAAVSANIQEIDITGAITGAGSVTAEGAASSLYLVSLPGYSGDTTVNSATLKLAASNPNNNASTVSIAATGATLELDFAGTDTVDKLFIGGVQQPAGVYEAVGNAGSGTEIAQITGTGTLTVTSSPAPASAYLAWAAGYPTLTNSAFDVDFENDGIKNGLEWILGGSPVASDPSVLPTLVVTATDFEFSFSRIDESESETTQTFQYGTDLSGWTNIPIGAADSTSGIATIIVLENAAAPDSVKVSIPKSAAVGGKLFGRLNVTRP